MARSTPVIRPKRSYRTVLESLRQVWRIASVPEEDAVWHLGKAAQESLDPAHIRVAIWNMYKGSGGVLFEHDYRSLCYRSDLVLTQEALLSKRSMNTYCEPGFQALHAASYVRRDGLRDGVMTVSRAQARPPVRRVVCKYPEPFLKTPKVALIQAFELHGTDDRLLVINIHATLMRLKAAAVEEMEHLINAMPSHDGPMLLAGDFNTFTPGYLRAVAGTLQKLGLDYVPIPNDPRPRTQALDQVFVRGLEVNKIHVDTTIKNSDHFPILLEFRVR